MPAVSADAAASDPGHVAPIQTRPEAEGEDR